MKLAFQIVGLALLLFLTWSIRVYHLAVFPKPGNLTASEKKINAARWYPRNDTGVNHLVLFGNPYERGVAAGRLTQTLLYLEEKILVEQYKQFIPHHMGRKAFNLLLMRWFWGVDQYLEPWMVEEMAGVAESASEDFNFLADPLTRQVAYHGLHEVGQFAVDTGHDDRGCTVFVVPAEGSWIVGRNFDFEASRIFDEEKILKWVFPDKGNAFISVIWAGMVGAVTGVNEHGLYLSINAAGSQDFRRYGTPSTLVLLKALQFAKTAKEAIQIIEEETMFVTDIFIVVDPESSVYRVEKSPRRTQVIEYKGRGAITNHLHHPKWRGDPTNQKRKREFTTLARYMRGEILLADLGLQKRSLKELEPIMLGFLRDKNNVQGTPLALGNRSVIDALIATHSVIYNAKERMLFVGEGPGVSGAFIGFDLNRSFKEQQPVESRRLPPDPKVTKKKFYQVRQALKQVAIARKLIRKELCDEGKAALDRAEALYAEHSNYYLALGDYYDCVGEREKAKKAWKASLERFPAYAREREYLEERLQP